MTARRAVQAAGPVRTETHEESGTVTLVCRVTGGPQTVIGRSGRLYLTDEELLGVLADLAVHPHWAVAFRAAMADPVVRDAARGVYHLNSGDRRKRLREAMAAAMNETGEQP